MRFKLFSIAVAANIGFSRKDIWEGWERSDDVFRVRSVVSILSVGETVRRVHNSIRPEDYKRVCKQIRKRRNS